MKKKILIVLTNISQYQDYEIPTGLWLGELTHFYDEIQKYGYEADFVSPSGGYVPLDPYSMKFMDETDYKWYKDSQFVERALANSLRPNEIDFRDYDAIYYTGGHGVLWDFPDNHEIQELAQSIYKAGGYVTAVCHGVVGLLNLKDENGEFLLKNRQVTGFTDTEELLSRKKDKVPFSTEGQLKSRGGQFSKKRFFSSYAIQDGQLITGQNPWSPRAVARLLLENLMEQN